MNLKVESNAFTILTEMIGISNVNIELYDYLLENQTLKGNIRISGEYYTNNLEYEENNGLREFENIIPYEIVFTKEHTNINSIEIKDFEYYEVAGRGIEANFIIDVDYDIEESRQEKNELIKEEITKEIDELLTEKIETVEDNFFEEEAIITEERNLVSNINDTKNKKDPKVIIKVIYYKNDENIKELCNKHNISYDLVLKENQKYSFQNNPRIIVSECNEHCR